MDGLSQYQEGAIVDLKKLDKVIQKRIIKKITGLGENFERVTPLPLSESWAGFYKFRVGDYRVIYGFDIDLKILWIEKIGHRREIYN